MKPGHIRVFDGLRLTTEHLEHLQGALHSAVRDLRAIAGLGRVHSGFEVVAEGAGVRILPGLGFDFAGNRLVSEEAKSVAVAFAPGEERKFVCLAYEAVEGGVVEGRPTLIFDSCAVSLRDAAPEPAANLVVLAELVRRPQEPGFEVEAGVPEEEEAATGAEGAPPSAEAAGEAAPGRPVPPAAEGSPAAEAPAGAQPPEGTPPEGTPPEGTPPEGTTAEEIPPEETPAEESTAPAAGAAAGPAVRQGVVRWASTGDGVDLAATVSRVLELRDEAAGEGASELHFPLAEAVVPLGFRADHLSSQTVLAATLRWTAATGSAASVPGGGPEPAFEELAVDGTAGGEATFAGGRASQFAVSSLRARDRSPAGEEPLRWVSTVTEEGLAGLPVAELATPGVGGVGDVLEHLELKVRVEPLPDTGLRLLSQLVWKGGADRGLADLAGGRKLRLRWKADVAWKAIGGAADRDGET